MNASDLKVNVTLTVNGAVVPLWRVRLLGLASRLLHIPLVVGAEAK